MTTSILQVEGACFADLKIISNSILRFLVAKEFADPAAEAIFTSKRKKYLQVSIEIKTTGLSPCQKPKFHGESCRPNQDWQAFVRGLLDEMQSKLLQ